MYLTKHSSSNNMTRIRLYDAALKNNDTVICRNTCIDVVEALIRTGRVVVQLEFADNEGIVFQKLVHSVGQPDGHDKNGRIVWDVKYDPSVNQNTAARSLTMSEFPMHTDACFDEPPPKYVGLYVIRQDQLGGGQSRFIDGHRLLARISQRSLVTLQESLFSVRVPNEFFKGKRFVEVRLVDKQGNFRYRNEIIVKSECSSAQLDALDELESLIAEPALVDTFTLPTGSMILFDNGRYLHARSDVKDRERHLLRMRFQPAEHF